MTAAAASLRDDAMTAATIHYQAHPWARVGGPPEHAGRDPEDHGLEPEIGPDVRISAFCSVDAGMREPTRIGARSWLLQHAHVGHDAQVGEDVIIATGAIIGGHARIGDGAHLGLGAIVLPFRKVGAGACIGAGAVVTRNVPAGAKWAGNPAGPVVTSDPRPFSER